MFVSKGDILTDTSNATNPRIVVTDVNTTGIIGRVKGSPDYEYFMPWKYAEQYAKKIEEDASLILWEAETRKARQELIAAMDCPGCDMCNAAKPKSVKDGYINISVVTRPHSEIARIIFEHDREVLAHVKHHDGTLARAYERATLGFSPEKEWLTQAMVVAECIT
jgi:hypothetical protein